MPDVAKLEAEAEAKGLHGQAEKRYVGGVFNKIRQAHARVTQPGKGARHLKRAARQEARAAMQNRVKRHEQLSALEKLRLRGRTRREEPRGQAPRAATSEQILHTQLKPIKYVEDREINPAAPLDPYFLHEVYGGKQLHTALSLFPNEKLREGVEQVKERNPGTRPRGTSRAALLAYIEQHVK